MNVHGTEGEFWNLGLVRVSGSMPSEKGIQLLQNKLSQNGLSLEHDIVGVTTDGATVMTKVGRSISAHHQMCTAHGIQLGILDILYKLHQIHQCWRLSLMKRWSWLWTVAVLGRGKGGSCPQTCRLPPPPNILFAPA